MVGTPNSLAEGSVGLAKEWTLLLRTEVGNSQSLRMMSFIFIQMMCPLPSFQVTCTFHMDPDRQNTTTCGRGQCALC